MKSLNEFLNEAAQKNSTSGKYFKNTVLHSGSASTRDDIEDWLLGYFAASNSATRPIIAIAKSIEVIEEYIDKAIAKFPDDNEIKEYKKNLKKLQKLIEDNF